MSAMMLKRLAQPRVQVAIGISTIILFFAYAYAFFWTSDVPYASPAHPESHAPEHHDYVDVTAPISTPQRMSRVHYLVPATQSTDTLCAGVVGALANGWPAPRILGYKGQGEFDAHAAHIAKLRTIKRYLYTVDSSKDDDLVLVMDGYDVLPQIPAEIMIERYFELTAKADRKLADQRGITIKELHARGMAQTLLWGTDKGCFPSLLDEARCWEIPFSDLPRYAWGPKSNPVGDVPYSDPRFLNSGTVIGPLGDMRKLMDATLDHINATWDDKFEYKNSDQYYISELYARQEHQRTLDMNKGNYPYELTGNRTVPAPRKDPQDETEYHVFVDFESAFAQTRCHNDAFMKKVKYANHDLSGTVKDDAFAIGKSFRPYDIQMPTPVYRGFSNVWKSLRPEERPKDTSDSWIKSLQIYTNVATHHITAFYHHTCSKPGYVERHRASWYYPLVQPLLRAARRKIDQGEPLHPGLVDGRLWLAPERYPSGKKFADELGGVFTDLAEEPFIPLQEFCKKDLSATAGFPAEKVPEADKDKDKNKDKDKTKP